MFTCSFDIIQMFIPLLVTYRCGFESMSFYKYKTKNSLLIGVSLMILVRMIISRVRVGFCFITNRGELNDPFKAHLSFRCVI
jgi:hypothetical protein